MRLELLPCYEYFPNKESLLVALAERHVAEAENGIEAALREATDTRELVEALQAAVLCSHRYPSQALGLIADSKTGAELRARVDTLRMRMLHALAARASQAGLPDPELRARTAFTLFAELGSRSAYDLDAERHRRYAQHLFELALTQLE